MNFPLVQGFVHSWAGLKIKKGSDDVFGFRKLSWKKSRSRKKVFAHGVQALGRTRGKEENEASISFLYPQWQLFKKSLGEGYMDKQFDLLVMREEIGNDELFKVEFISCSIDEHSNDESEGEDESIVDVTLGVLRIVDDGDLAIFGELQ